MVVGLLTGTSHAEEKEKNRLPDVLKTVLEKATELEIYSVDPAPSKDGEFHGFKILGKTTIKDADKRKELLTKIDAGLANSKGGAKCFDPRHGIRAVHDGKTVDLVICFACSWVYVYSDQEKREVVLETGSDAQELLNKILTDAGVKLAPKDKK